LLEAEQYLLERYFLPSFHHSANHGPDPLLLLRKTSIRANPLAFGLLDPISLLPRGKSFAERMPSIMDAKDQGAGYSAKKLINVPKLT
jgi:hypothetical protein